MRKAQGPVDAGRRYRIWSGEQDGKPAKRITRDWEGAYVSYWVVSKQCTCPQATQRKRRCRHLDLLKAAEGQPEGIWWRKTASGEWEKEPQNEED